MITFRKATSQDVSLLQKLNNEVFIDNAQYDPDLVLDWAESKAGEQYFTSLCKSEHAVCIIAESNGRAIGYIAASYKTIDYRKSKYIEVENMGVIPEFRSEGIGEKLMEHCNTWAKKEGYHRVFVTSYFANKRAIAFYKKCGFSEIDISLEKNI